MIYSPQCIKYPIKAFHYLADGSLLSHVHTGDLGSGVRAPPPGNNTDIGYTLHKDIGYTCEEY